MPRSHGLLPLGLLTFLSLPVPVPGLEAASEQCFQASVEAALAADSSESEATAWLQVGIAARQRVPTKLTGDSSGAADSARKGSVEDAMTAVKTDPSQTSARIAHSNASGNRTSVAAASWSTVLLSKTEKLVGQLQMKMAPASPATWTLEGVKSKLPEMLAVLSLGMLPLTAAIICCGLLGLNKPAHTEDRLRRCRGLQSIPPKVRERVNLDAPFMAMASLKQAANAASAANAEVAIQPASEGEEFTPGNHVVVDDVEVTAGASLSSQPLAVLSKGFIVEIVQIVKLPMERRLRGFLQSPAGWVSIMDLADRRIWLQKVK